MPDNTPPQAKKLGGGEPRDRGLHRHNSPPQGEKQDTVTGRPNDLPVEKREPVGPETYNNSTFGDRAKRSSSKRVTSDKAQNKAVKADETKGSG